MVETVSLHMSLKEIAYLAALLGNNELVGMDNPFLSVTQEQFKRELPIMQKTLEDKQYIEVNFDGSIVVDELVAVVVNLCCGCDGYLKVDAGGREIQYYLNQYLGIEMQEDKSGECVFQVWPEADAIVQSVLNKIEFTGDDIIGDLNTFTLTGQVLDKVRELVDDGKIEEASSALLEAGVDALTAGEMVGLMKKPDDFASILFVQMKDARACGLQDLTWLKGRNALWVVKIIVSDEETLYDFSPVPLDSVNDVIKEFMTQVNSLLGVNA
ncbi:MAG TPA: hypothetical protein VN426_11420 [Syntrophomonadaceae bacterium]|nr:hypothetical protein [Syntrophomonadaceae bacterium]